MLLSDSTINRFSAFLKTLNSSAIPRMFHVKMEPSICAYLTDGDDVPACTILGDVTRVFTRAYNLPILLYYFKGTLKSSKGFITWTLVTYDWNKSYLSFNIFHSKTCDRD